jgi:hypothetical protein
VFENRVLRRIFGHEREEVAGEDCIMRSFITCGLHQNIIKVIQWRGMRWAGHVARMGEM